VYWIAENIKGISDPEVWSLAASRAAILLTSDLRVIPQLKEGDVLNGPDLIEYSTKGFTKSELQDPVLMRTVLGWVLSERSLHRL
jgi:hypothetical protein